MARVRKNCKAGGVAEQVYNKTNLSLIKFCELNGLSYGSMVKGYYSKRTIKVLKKYGIDLDSVAYKVAGGSDGVWVWANKETLSA